MTARQIVGTVDNNQLLSDLPLAQFKHVQAMANRKLNREMAPPGCRQAVCMTLEAHLLMPCM